MKAADSHVPYQDLESRQLLVGFLDAPELFESHIKRYTNSQTTQTVYGFRTTSIHDPQLKQFFESFEEVMLAASNTAAALLDVYPVLRRLPEFLVPIKRRAKSLHETEKTLYMGHWLAAKKAAEKDTLKVKTSPPPNTGVFFPHSCSIEDALTRTPASTDMSDTAVLLP